MEASNNISAPKLQRRPIPTQDQFPIYLKSTNNKNVFYKLFSPHQFMMIGFSDEALDVRVRKYSNKVETTIFDEYLKGSPEYEIADRKEFEQTFLSIEHAQRAYILK